MADHRTLISSEVHEPKHISDSTSADAGKVITPSLAGQSELRSLTPEEVGMKFIYGEIAVDQNNDPFSIPQAVQDPLLYDTSDYVQLNSVRVPSAYLDQSNGISFNSNTNSMTPSVAGVYRVNFWMNVKSNVANTKLGVKAKQDGTWANFTVKSDVKEADRTQNISGCIMLNLDNTNDISLWMASDKNANVVVQDMRLDLMLIQEI